jgi:hypothetical protein
MNEATETTTTIRESIADHYARVRLNGVRIRPSYISSIAS